MSQPGWEYHAEFDCLMMWDLPSETFEETGDWKIDSKALIEHSGKKRKAYPVAWIDFYWMPAGPGYSSGNSKYFVITKNEDDERWELWLYWYLNDCYEAWLTVRGPIKNVNLEEAAIKMLKKYFEGQGEPPGEWGEHGSQSFHYSYENCLKGVDIDKIFKEVNPKNSDKID